MLADPYYLVNPPILEDGPNNTLKDISKYLWRLKWFQLSLI